MRLTKRDFEFNNDNWWSNEHGHIRKVFVNSDYKYVCWLHGGAVSGYIDTLDEAIEEFNTKLHDVDDGY